MGGNSLGIMACRDDQRIVRQMPGRIVGLTKTISGGRRGFVLALATREQHIRRERATSNICTNMTLMAIAASVYLASMGRDGMHAVAERIMENTAYAMKRLKGVAGMTPLFNGVHFRDFVMIGRGIDGMEKRLLSKGIVGGKDISEDIGVGGTRLYAVTEVMDRRDIDAFADALSQIEGEH
jgi:glycine dehydrogenase subunit 1